MDELVQFLRARLDEDEQLARAATQGEWVWSREFVTPPGYHHRTVGPLEPGDAAYIAHQHPARVLRDIEAKRKLLALYVEHERMDRETFEAEGEHARSLVSLRAAYFDAVRFHAAVYADHPSYREEWRP
jgi:hypothetical protein